MKLPLLLRKMFRDIARSLPAYLISGCIVTIGVIGYSVLSISCDNLDHARDRFYADSAFADGFAEVVMAPKALERSMERIAGITTAEGRLVLSSRMNREGGDTEVELYSYTDSGLCKPQLQSGSMPQDNEILLGSDFMRAHKLAVGDSISLVVRGRKVTLRISGTALSPETVYMVKDIADMLPDPSRYDAGYLHYSTLSALLGGEQQANSFVFLTDNSRPFDAIEDDLEVLLRPYGVSTIYPQADQFSYAMLDAEIVQVTKMATSVPFLFLGIAAIILTISLSRLVEQQRVQIGTLMALGMTPRHLLWHYCGYGATIGFVGGAIGSIVSVFAADAMSGFYRQYFKIPSYGLYITPWYLVGGAVVATIVCGGIAWFSARSVLELTPAVALRPAPPKKATKAAVEKIPGLMAALTVTGRIAVRGLFRNRRKTVLSLVGVACAYMISASLLSMYSMLDLFIFDYLEDTQRQDVMVSFSQPVSEADARRAIRSRYIELAECVAELPVTLQGPSGTLDCMMMALEPDAQLYRLYNKAGDPVPIGDSGAVISQHMSNLLGVGVGGSLTVKTTYPQERTEQVTVTGIAEQYLGATAYTSRPQLARIADTGSAVTAVYIKTAAEGQAELRASLEQNGVVGTIQTRADKVEGYRTMMGSFSGIFFAMAMMGVLIGFAVVYTGSLISFEELKREVSTLLALGLSSGQAVEVISVGQWLIAFGGILLGLPMSVLVSKTISQSMSTDLYSIPDFINLSSLVLAAGLTMLSVWLGTMVIYRKINRINPVELLRERE